MKLCSECQNIFDKWSQIRNDTRYIIYPHHVNVFELEASSKNGCRLCTQWLQSLEVIYGPDLEDLRKTTQEILRRGQKPGQPYVEVNASSPGLEDTIPWMFSLKYPALPELSTLGLADGVKKGSLEPQSNPTTLESIHTHLKPDEATDESLEDENSKMLWQGSKAMHSSVDILPAFYAYTMDTSEPILGPLNRYGILQQTKKWLEVCQTSHKSCTASQTLELPSRLVYIGSKDPRLQLTSNLKVRPVYATLSHSWGQLKLTNLSLENLESFQRRIPAEALSKTFSDAIYIAQKLGIDYIWIDSLCIIQNDIKDWRKESALMRSVYNGSAINIAASSAIDGRIGCFFHEETDQIFRHRITVKSEDKFLVYDCAVNYFDYDCLNKGPLSRRGWVLQERVLAPRILHFNNSLLFWECNEITTCEIFPDAFPGALQHRFLIDPLRKKTNLKPLWPTIVRHFTDCDLTEERDKLVAISGLARTIQDHCKDEYLAGLWREDLERQLCWHGSLLRKKPISYRAPSWSWAATNSKGIETLLPHSNQSLLVHVLDATTTVIEPGSLGEVSGGHIRLTAPFLMRGNLRCKKEHTSVMNGDTCLLQSFEYDHSDYSKGDGDQVYVLPVVENTQFGHALGLVLEATLSKQGQYNRIGNFAIREESCKALKDLMQLKGNQALASDFVEASSRNGTTMAIILI